MSTLLEKLGQRYKPKPKTERMSPDGNGGVVKITPVNPLQIQKALNNQREQLKILNKDLGQLVDDETDKKRGKKKGHRNDHR